MPHEGKLRITFILPHAGMAGGIRVIAIYAHRLQQRGHRVRVISTPWEPWGRIAKARQQMMALLEHFNLMPPRTPNPSHIDALDIDHVRIKHARPITDADVPDGDVVIATWWETASWVAGLSDRKGAKTYFVQDYGCAVGQPLESVAATWTLPLRKIAISKWLVRLVEEQSGDARVEYVPNAVDHERFWALPRAKQKMPTVGFLYNPAPQKGCDIIIEAVRMARQSHPDLQVVSFGPGTPTHSLPVPEGTKYWTCVSDDELRSVYGQCDAWLFGSRREGFGLPILEAMACRTPVIATPAGAAPELVSPESGILLASHDPLEMADAIQRVVSASQMKWKSMSEHAYAASLRYTWEDATDLFEAALFRAVDDAVPQMAM